MEYALMVIFNKQITRVILRQKYSGHWIGKWNFPGNKIADKDPRGAALSAVYEETLFDIQSFDTYNSLVTLSFPDDCVLHTYYGVLKEGKENTLTESELLQWWEINDLLNVRDSRLAGNGNIPYLVQSALIDIKSAKSTQTVEVMGDFGNLPHIES